MKLPALGVEYVRWDVSADLELIGTLEVGFVVGDPETQPTSWLAATWQGADVLLGTDAEGVETHLRSFRMLLAGSAVPTPDPGAAQLSPGLNHVWVRITDAPEVIIRPAGRLTAE